ncbi:hypothetical protein QYM36_001665, partial [Artemia franciscana]
AKTTFIATYAPTNKSNDSDEDNFYQSLSDVTNKVHSHDILVVSGDFMAKMGCHQDYTPTVIGSHGLGEITENGMRLVDYCITNDMIEGVSDCHSVNKSHDNNYKTRNYGTKGKQDNARNDRSRENGKNHQTYKRTAWVRSPENKETCAFAESYKVHLRRGYWQLKMHPEVSADAVFITPFGLYQFRYMPFGLKRTPATLQRL